MVILCTFIFSINKEEFRVIRAEEKQRGVTEGKTHEITWVFKTGCWLIKCEEGIKGTKQS